MYVIFNGVRCLVLKEYTNAYLIQYGNTQVTVTKQEIQGLIDI